MIFPRCAPASSLAWAAAASASGKTASIMGRNRPASIHGQTTSSMRRASRAFSSAGRLRRVDPVRVARFYISAITGTSSPPPSRAAM